jgi:hypothetical protein
VRYGTSQALRNLIRSCISEEMVVAAVAARNLQQQQMEEGGGKGRPVPASHLQSVIVALASTLGAQYREGWEHALPGEPGNMQQCHMAICLGKPSCATHVLCPVGVMSERFLCTVVWMCLTVYNVLLPYSCCYAKNRVPHVGLMENCISTSVLTPPHLVRSCWRDDGGARWIPRGWA